MPRRKAIPLKTKLECLIKYIRCPGCGWKFGLMSDVEFDHIMPVALSGSNEPSNLQPLCKKCHKKKTGGSKATSYGSDMHEIAKAKRIAKGGKKRKGPPIRSRGFSKSLKKGKK